MSGRIVLADGSELDLALYPLPDGLEDTVALNRAQLARAFDVSENTISKWVAEGMPAEVEGSSGQAYEFRLSHCWAWRQHREARLRSRRAEAERLAVQASLAFRNLEDEDPADGALTAKQIREESLADYERNRAAQLRGELVKADQVRMMVQEVLIAFRNGMVTLPDFCEREFGLTPEQVDRLQRRCNETLVSVRREIETGIEDAAGQVVPLASGNAQERMF